MHGRHIALFPLPGKSHLTPFLGLCPELIRRGYRVTLATIEALAKHAVPAGAEPAIFDMDSTRWMALDALQNGERPMMDPKLREQQAGIFSRWLLNSAAIAVSQLDKFYKNNRPDLVIYESAAYAGPILAKRLRSPAIQYYPDFITHNGHVLWRGTMGYNPQSIVVEFARLLDSFLWAYGFEETDYFWHSENLNFYQIPREFQFDSELIDTRRFCFVGPFLDRPFRPMWKNRSGGKRVVLVSAISGLTDANYFNKVIDALSESDYHVILSVGEHFPISELPTLPTNFEINQFGSHLEILPHTDLHLYSGGPHSTVEGFYFGVPLIAVPSFEQDYCIASRLAELGAVLNLPLHGLTSQTIRENVDAVLQDAGVRRRVQQIQHVVRGSGGSVMAVDRIEEFLAGRA